MTWATKTSPLQSAIESDFETELQSLKSADEDPLKGLRSVLKLLLEELQFHSWFKEIYTWLNLNKCVLESDRRSFLLFLFFDIVCLDNLIVYGFEYKGIFFRSPSLPCPTPSLFLILSSPTERLEQAGTARMNTKRLPFTCLWPDKGSCC